MQRPEVVNQKGIGTLFAMVGQHVGLALAPVLGACFVAGLAASAGQVGLKPTPQAIKPDFKKINPASGLKQMFNPQHLAFETAKNLRQDRDRRRDRGASRSTGASTSSPRWWACRRSS